MSHYLTLDQENRFSFTCPIFDSKVEMRGCVLVRDMVYQGKNFPQRQGCQVCIRGGKCPAAEIVRRIAHNQPNATDRCSATEPVHGKLPADVLEFVRPTVMLENALRRLAGSEVTMIQSANDRIDAQIATAPRERVAGKVTRVSATANYEKPEGRSTARKSAPASKPAANVEAAISGDMSAAINAAA
ncbi:hypothetical protein [Paracoccus litorisediminis]|uniref:Uncharacterized protein n=1 Tax=Paracoccus litorisediminis TaxID=2006130 RepID=A0A844HLE2_9RHOB|nr:hypothetical protein [Paracoccus litorisediminis]MTH61083.1 hypothetical protein [Paracoccus litorisediminis]